MKNKKIISQIEKTPVYGYASNVLDGTIVTNEYIKIACKDFIDELNDPNSKYIFSYKSLKLISNVLKLIVMPDGLSTGKSAYDALAGFQWFFIGNALCWKMADNHAKRRYEQSLLFIARKNGKTFIVGVLFILLLLLEPKFSKFFSVAPNLEESTLIKQQMDELIKVSPALVNHFDVKKRDISQVDRETIFTPLATSKNRMDGRKASVFVADEVGALPDRGPIDAMISSQMNMLNRTGILISTAYDTLSNPMTSEVNIAKRNLKSKKEDRDPTLFSLLYMPDKPKEWMTNDDELLKANPLAAELSDNFDFLKTLRRRAIDDPGKRREFLTKHLDVFLAGEQTEKFLNESDVDAAQLKDDFDWNGKSVYVGLDLAVSNDNTGVTMSYYDPDYRKMFAKSWCFWPKGRADEKSRTEHINYQAFEDAGYGYGCGSMSIDYGAIGDFIESLPDKYGVTIRGICYDKYNAADLISRLSNDGFDCIVVPQNTVTLYPGTKFVRELFENKLFKFDKNELFRLNLTNAKVVVNPELAYRLRKKEVNTKIDMAAALMNTSYAWYNDIVNDNLDDDDALIHII